MEGADVVTPGPTRPPDPPNISKNTQRSKFLLSQTLKWKKIMLFVIPEMPSKTFVMVKKNFLITLTYLFEFVSLRLGQELVVGDHPVLVLV